MVDQLYGFRPKPPNSAHQKTDDVIRPFDARVPTLGNPPVPTPVKAEEPYHSGVSAENDDDGGGSSFNNGTTNASQVAYDSQREAKNAALAGYEHGYYGTVQDAAQQAATGNQKAAGALGSFVQNTANNPTGAGFGPKAPGLFGYALHSAGLNQNQHGGVTQNVTDAIYGLEASGNLYSSDNSSGYQGKSLTEQQNLADIHNATVFGDWSGAEQGAPETFSDDDQSFQDNYDFHQDNSSDDNGGATDGSQTGGETSHGGGYGGFADDSASSDSGGGK